jgi:hypothetical protein
MRVRAVVARLTRASYFPALQQNRRKMYMYKAVLSVNFKNILIANSYNKTQLLTSVNSVPLNMK